MQNGLRKVYLLQPVQEEQHTVLSTREFPSDWFYRQRAYPQGYIDPELRKVAFEQAERLKAAARAQNVPQWIARGPSNVGGRITTMAISRQNPDVIYIGDVGCYFTTNTGASWQAMGTGLPNAAISDMQIHAPTRIALAFTHGRSMWEINLDDLTAVAENREIPVRLELYQNYPNPFSATGGSLPSRQVVPAGAGAFGGNPASTISFTLSRSAFVTLSVFDINGREVATLLQEELSASYHCAVFHARNYASGVYLYRLTAGASSPTRRMLLLK